MTPEQNDGFSNAWVQVDQLVGVYGPGLAVAAVGSALVWACKRGIGQCLRRRRQQAQELHEQLELGQMAALSAAIDNAPLIPTQPGFDQQSLGTCNAILRATKTREETDQP